MYFIKKDTLTEHELCTYRKRLFYLQRLIFVFATPPAATVPTAVTALQ